MNNEDFLLFSPNANRRDQILDIIKQLGCCSVETISVLVGLNKRKVSKVVKSLKEHKNIRLITKKETYYYGVTE